MIYPNCVRGLCQFCGPLLIGYALLFTPARVEADSGGRSYRARAELANCSYYRSKKADIPVYRDADTASEVVARLRLGEEVCYIGERAAFAIVDWSKQAVIRGAAESGAEEQRFVRLVDLWPPRESQSHGWGISEWWMRYGGAMDDPLGGLRGDPK